MNPVLKIPTLILFVFCTSNVFGVQDQSEETFSIEQILFENWSAASESIRNSHIQLRLFRKLLNDPKESQQFDLEKYLALVKQCGSEKSLEDALPKLKQMLHPKEVDNERLAYWDWKVEAWERGASNRVTWRDASDKLVEDYAFTEHGVATHQAGQPINIRLDSSMERFRFEGLIYLPRFESADRFKVAESGVKIEFPYPSDFPFRLRAAGNSELLVQSENNYNFLVRELEGDVAEALFYRGNSGVLRHNIGSTEMPTVDFSRPALVSNIHFHDGQPILVSLVFLQSVEINTQLPPSIMSLPVRANSLVMDMRGGNKPQIHVAQKHHESVFEFVKNSKPRVLNREKTNTIGSSEPLQLSAPTDKAKIESPKSVAPVDTTLDKSASIKHLQIRSADTVVSRQAPFLLLLAVVTAFSLVETFCLFFPLKESFDV